MVRHDGCCEASVGRTTSLVWVMRLAAATVTAAHDPDLVAVHRPGWMNTSSARSGSSTLTRPDGEHRPWSIMFTDLDTGAVLDVSTAGAEPRSAGGCGPPRAVAGGVQIVAIDMSSEFRAAIRDVLPPAWITADH